MDLTAGAPESILDDHVHASAVVTIRGNDNGLDDDPRPRAAHTTLWSGRDAWRKDAA